MTLYSDTVSGSILENASRLNGVYLFGSVVVVDVVVVVSVVVVVVVPLVGSVVVPVVVLIPIIILVVLLLTRTDRVSHTGWTRKKSIEPLCSL